MVRPILGDGLMRCGGFTLIELMLTLALAAILAMAALPMTIAWMDGVRQVQARGLLVDAVGRARALAVRNPDRLAQSQAVARVQLANDGTLSVVRNGTGAVLWSGSMPSSVQLEDSAAAPFSCVAYNSRALPVNAGGCTTDGLVLVQAGSREAINVQLF